MRGIQDRRGLWGFMLSVVVFHTRTARHRVGNPRKLRILGWERASRERIRANLEKGEFEVAEGDLGTLGTE